MRVRIVGWKRETRRYSGWLSSQSKSSTSTRSVVDALHGFASDTS